MELTTEFEFNFERHQIAELAITVGQPGYEVHNKIAQVIVNSYFAKALKATDPAKGFTTKQQSEFLREARIAAEVYSSIVGTINEYVYDYTHAPKSTDAPLDVTKDLNIDDNDYHMLEEELI